MKQERDKYTAPVEIFPYMPTQSDISIKSFRSREKGMTPTYKSFTKGIDKPVRDVSPHHQNKPFPQPAERFSLPNINYNTPRKRYAGGPMIRQMDGLTTKPLDDVEINPKPAPFKSEDFLSSTVMKNVPISKRHLDNFTSLDNIYSGKRGVALHTQRYNWDTNRSFDSLSQRDRLLAEIEGLERLRDIKRKTEILPHRLPLNLSMGGKRLDIEERFDINREIRKLKAMVLPQYAKDLYHGRGINLPRNHASIKPRKQPTDDDSDDEISSSAPASLRRNARNHQLGGNLSRSFMDVPLTHRGEKLPSIAKKPTLGFNVDQSVKRSNSNVLPSLHRNPSSWVEEQNQNLKETEDTNKDSIDVRIPKIERSDTTVTPGAPPPTAGGGTVPSPQSTHIPPESVTPYPLKASELISKVPEEQKDALKERFKKLDTDADGHLKYDQLRPELPSEYTPEQEMFLKQVYDITSSITFFGIEEFLTMSQLGNKVNELSGEAKEAFEVLKDLDVRKFITKHVELYQAVDRNHKGKITMNALQEIISTSIEKDLSEDPELWNKILNNVNTEYPDHITKIEYLAHLPYFHSMGVKS